MANPRIKKLLDYKFSYGVAYTMHAAINRNREHIDHLFFLYGLMKGTGDYLAKLYGQKKLNKACLALAEACETEDEDPDRSVDFVTSLKFSPSVARCVEMVRSGKNDVGLLGAIAAICSEHPDAMQVLETSGITRDVIEKAAVAEVNTINSQGTKDAPKSGRRSAAPSGHPTSALAELCIDLTEQASRGELNQTFCREREIDGVVLSLMRKIKNNPLLIGDPGVGKTAIVEGLAYRIASGDVPKKLKGARLYSLAMSTLVSGTSLRGQFEERLQAVVENICQEENALLFIDEVHTLVGAGDNNGVMDAGNVLKPYLARGELRCIGATTFRDYNRTIKRDGALSRRFHNIVVHEVDTSSTLDILKGLKPSFEDFHECKIENEAIEEIVRLSSRYLTERRFPDKAIDCLDDSCARAVLDGSNVDVDRVEQSVAFIANVPLSMLRSSDADRLGEARPMLKGEIIGNDAAIDELCDLMMGGFSHGKKTGSPLCSLIVHGPSGVGKKSVVRRLSEMMFGSDAFIMLNGAEYVEPHSISKIIGSPPGYVGYNEESKIVRQVRRCPHSFIVVDGIEKMNVSVRGQIFDMIKTGRMTTGEGDDVDLGNAVFVLLQDSGFSRAMGFSSDSNESSMEGLDRWNSYGIFGSVDGVVRFSEVKSPEDLRRIAALEIEEYDAEGWDGVKDMTEEILEENMDACPSKIRREIRRGLEKLASEEDADLVSVVKT